MFPLALGNGVHQERAVCICDTAGGLLQHLAKLVHAIRRRTMKKEDGILDAIGFLLSIPFGVGGFALQCTVCPQKKGTKARPKGTEKLKENEMELQGPVPGAGKM